MQRHSRFIGSLCQLLTCASLLVGTALSAADANGTWTWTMQGRNGGPDRKSTLKLKAEGEKVTGTVSSPGREGQAVETKIEDGMLSGDDISFTVTREFNGNKFVAKYSGKVGADSIKGKVETERDGNTRSREWEAKREAAEKK